MPVPRLARSRATDLVSHGVSFDPRVVCTEVRQVIACCRVVTRPVSMPYGAASLVAVPRSKDLVTRSIPSFRFRAPSIAFPPVGLSAGHHLPDFRSSSRHHASRPHRVEACPPLRSVLGLSLPLDGFLRFALRRFVSPRSHVQDFPPFRGFFPRCSHPLSSRGGPSSPFFAAPSPGLAPRVRLPRGRPRGLAPHRDSSRRLQG